LSHKGTDRVEPDFAIAHIINKSHPAQLLKNLSYACQIERITCACQSRLMSGEAIREHRDDFVVLEGTSFHPRAGTSVGRSAVRP